MFSEENNGGDQVNKPEVLAILKVKRIFSTDVVPANVQTIDLIV